MKIRKGAVAIIFRQDEFLILKRELNWKGWEFVKGSIDEGEDEETAVKREIREETGLEDIEIIHKLPEKLEYMHPEKTSMFWMLQTKPFPIYYPCSVKTVLAWIKLYGSGTI